MRIGKREIGPGQPCCVCAECSNSHNGSFDRLMKMLVAARDAGADVAKIQAYTPTELLNLRGDGPAPEPWGSQGYSMHSLYTKAATPLDWLPAVFEGAKQIGIPLFASVFGPSSLAALLDVGCPALKVSHLDAHDMTLARLVLATGKPVIVSGNGERGAVIDYFRYPHILMVYCPEGYPTPLESMRLSSPLVGLSSHCLDPLVAPLAVAGGAQYLEYHFMLEAEPSELEANVSLNEREFRAMVDSVRKAEVLLGR